MSLLKAAATGEAETIVKAFEALGITCESFTETADERSENADRFPALSVLPPLRFTSFEGVAPIAGADIMLVLPAGQWDAPSAIFALFRIVTELTELRDGVGVTLRSDHQQELDVFACIDPRGGWITFVPHPDAKPARRVSSALH